MSFFYQPFGKKKEDKYRYDKGSFSERADAAREEKRKLREEEYLLRRELMKEEYARKQEELAAQVEQAKRDAELSDEERRKQAQKRAEVKAGGGYNNFFEWMGDKFEANSPQDQAKREAQGKQKEYRDNVDSYGSVFERLGDAFEANSPQDKAKRLSKGLPEDYKESEQVKKEREEKAQNFDLSQEEIDLRRDFYNRLGFDIDKYSKLRNSDYQIVHDAAKRGFWDDTIFGNKENKLKDVDLKALAEKAEKEGLFENNEEAKKELEQARQLEAQGSKSNRNFYAQAIRLATKELGMEEDRAKIEGQFQTRIKQEENPGNIAEKLGRNTIGGFTETFAQLPSNLQSLGSNALDIVSPEGSRFDKYAQERFDDAARDNEGVKQEIYDKGIGQLEEDGFWGNLGRGAGSLAAAGAVGPGGAGKAAKGFWGSVKAFAKPSVVGTLFGINKGGDIVRESRAMGNNSTEAGIQSLVAGYAEGVLENFGLTKMFSRFGTGRMAGLVGGAITEGSQEFLQDMSTSFVQATYKDVDWGEALGQAWQSAVIGGILGGGAGVISGGAAEGGDLQTELIKAFEQQGVSPEDAQTLAQQYQDKIAQKLQDVGETADTVDPNDVVEDPNSVVNVRPPEAGPSEIPGTNIEVPTDVTVPEAPNVTEEKDLGAKQFEKEVDPEKVFTEKQVAEKFKYSPVTIYDMEGNLEYYVPKTKEEFEYYKDLIDSGEIGIAGLPDSNGKIWHIKGTSLQNIEAVGYKEISKLPESDIIDLYKPKTVAKKGTVKKLGKKTKYSPININKEELAKNEKSDSEFVRASLAEAKTMSDKDVYDELVRRIAPYATRGDSIKSLKDGQQGGTFKGGMYGIGGYIDGKKISPDFVGVELKDGRVYKFKLQDVYNESLAQAETNKEKGKYVEQTTGTNVKGRYYTGEYGGDKAGKYYVRDGNAAGGKGYIGEFETMDEAIAERNRLEKIDKGIKEESKPTQKQVVEKAVKGKPKSIKQVAEETGIKEPNIRRILGVGTKEGTFKRVDKGVYVLNVGGQDMAWVEAGDAVESLPRLVKEGFKADMVFLDIPYKTAAVTGGNRGVKYNLLTTDQFQSVVDDLKKIVKDENTPVFHMYSQATSGLKDMAKYNDIYAETFIPVARGEYTKTQLDGVTQVKNMRGQVIKPEGIIVGSLSGKLNFDNPNLNFKLVRPKGYQTEKPAEMLKALIEMSTKEGDVILDPFAGSGVTGAEAIKLNRKSYNIEVNEEVVENITKPRIEKAAKEKQQSAREEFLGMMDAQLRGTSLEGAAESTWGDLVFTRQEGNTEELYKTFEEYEIEDYDRVQMWKERIKNGERPPVLTITEDGKPRVVDGRHKLRAYKELGIETVPTINGAEKVKVTKEKPAPKITKEEREAQDSPFWELEGAAKNLYGKTANQLTNNQRKEIMEKYKFTVEGGAEAAIKIGNINSNYKTDDARPVLKWGGAKNNMYTNSYFAVVDKVAAKQINDKIADKEKKSLIKSFMTVEGTTYAEAEAEANQAIQKQQEDYAEQYPKMTKDNQFKLVEIYGTEAEIKGHYVSEGGLPITMFSDGETVALVNTDMVAYFAKTFPNAEYRIGDATSPVQVVETDIYSGNKKIVGVMMPLREQKDPQVVKLKEELNKLREAVEKDFEEATAGTEGMVADGQTSILEDNEPAFKQRAQLPRREVERDALEDKPISKKEAQQLQGLNEGIKMLSEAFEVPIRRGRMHMRRALGEHHTKEEIIRLRKIIGEGATEGGRFGVAVHEVGHNMSKNMPEFKIVKGQGIIMLGKEGNKDLSSISSQPGKGGSVYSEGFSEFMRYYVVNPEGIQKKMPETYKKIDTVLQEEYPGFYTALMRARNQWHSYQKAPATKKIMSQISYEQRKDGIRDRISKGIANIYTNWVNDLYPMEQLEKSVQKGGTKVDTVDKPSTLAFLYRGWYGKARTFLEYGTISNDPYVMNEKTEQWELKTNGKSFKEITHPIYSKGEEAEFDAYLVAKRMVSIKKQKGYTTGVAIQDAQDAINELEEKYPEFIQAQQELEQYQDRLIKYLVEAGTVSAEGAATFRALNQNYVPFYRVFEAAGAKGMFGRGYADLSSGIKKMKGSEADIISPMESIVKNTMVLIQAAEANKVGLAFADMAQDSKIAGQVFEKIKTPQAPVATITLRELGIVSAEKGIGSFEGLQMVDDADVDEAMTIFRPMFQDKSERIVTVLRKGKREFYYVEDPALYEAITMMNKEQANAAIKLLSYPASWLRAGATLTPEFVARNPMRDQFSAFVNSVTDYIPFVDAVKGAKKVITKDKNFWLWQASGAPYATLVSVDRNYDKLEVDRVTNGTFKTRFNNPNQRAALIKEKANIIKYLRDASETMENATRMGEFSEATGTHRNFGIKKRAMHPMEAAMASKEVTLNFSRGGTYGRTLNLVSAFFNAAVQDIDKNARMMKTRPVNYFTKGTILITLPSMLLYLMNRDEEWYKELPTWRKDFTWSFKIGDSPIFSIPKPFFLGTLFGTIPERIMGEIDGKGARDLGGFGELVLGSTIDPIGSVIPTALKPIIETITNFNFFTGRPIDPASEENLPNEMKYGPWTSEVAKILSKATGSIISPRMVDNILGGYFGGLGDYAVNSVDRALELAGRTDEYQNVEAPDPFTDIMFIKAFVARSPFGSGSESVNDLYNANARAISARDAASKLDDLVGKEAGDKYREDHPEYAFASTYTKFIGDLSEIRKQIDNIRKDKNKDPIQKRTEIDELEKRMTYIAQEALRFDPDKSDSKTPIPSETITRERIYYAAKDDIGEARRIANEHNEQLKKYLEEMGDYYTEEQKKKIYDDRKISTSSTSIKNWRKKASELE